jgi:AGZA family xanthine/uracil permease-like MFS transporter
MMAKMGLSAAGYGSPSGPAFSEKLIPAFLMSGQYIHGAFALSQGFIFTSMILAAATVAVIERQFVRAGFWCLSGCALSLLGLIHSYRFTHADTVVNLAPAWLHATGYAAMAAIFFGARFLTEPTDSSH